MMVVMIIKIIMKMINDGGDDYKDYNDDDQ